jgi:hypothetical protein
MEPHVDYIFLLLCHRSLGLALYAAATGKQAIDITKVDNRGYWGMVSLFQDADNIHIDYTGFGEDFASFLQEMLSVDADGRYVCHIFYLAIYS